MGRKRKVMLVEGYGCVVECWFGSSISVKERVVLSRVRVTCTHSHYLLQRSLMTHNLWCVFNFKIYEYQTSLNRVGTSLSFQERVFLNQCRLIIPGVHDRAFL